MCVISTLILSLRKLGKKMQQKGRNLRVARIFFFFLRATLFSLSLSEQVLLSGADRRGLCKNHAHEASPDFLDPVDKARR